VAVISEGINVDPYTSVYALFGDPVFHSMGPAMHNSAFARTGFNGIYLALRVTDIGAAISAMRSFGFKGASITIPHKVDVIKHLDGLDPIAERIGAVNTVMNKEGRLIGFNSDCLGAVEALSQKTVIKNQSVAVIGAGGAARAIGFGVANEGGRITIFNNSVEKGERLAEDVGADYRPLSMFQNSRFDILINATPVGMTPDIEAMPIPKEALARETVVMDAVYNPLKTRLLKEAESIGCRTVDGLSMFVYQGAFQFELWTGKKAPVDILRSVVMAQLSKT
jgi:shikimate dehydrogenase